MKLYFDPVSTTARPVMMFIAEHGLDVEFVHVDLMSNANLAPEYLAVNPNGIVPFLVDGDLKLGESTAILKYLARKSGSATYPSDLVAQAKVDEAVSWLSTQFHEYFCLFVCYPHMGVPHGAPPELLQALTAFGAEAAPRWLKILDGHMLADGPYLCGDEVTIADYLALSFVLLGDLPEYDFSPYPNIVAWVARMRERPSYEPTYGTFYTVMAAYKAMQQAA